PPWRTTSNHGVRPMERGQRLTDALVAYTGSLFAREDALLRDLNAEIERRGLPHIQIGPQQGRALQLLLRAIGARRVLEIGTLGGYSAIWMARALPPDGRLVTLELAEERAALAREFIRRAGLADRVEVAVGPAADTLRRLLEEGGECAWDACFIDADKDSYPAYLRWARRLVRVGGLILADNAYRAGAVLHPPQGGEAAAIDQFNRKLARDRGLLSTILPLGDGLAVALVTGPPGRRAED
ncbi:MAG TPA: O-methyltransferase, partial [Longimicrobiales bacterium]